MTWMAALAAAGLSGVSLPARATPTGGPNLSPPATIEWPAAPLDPGAGAVARSGPVVAQSQIDAGPLQGPLSAAGADGRTGRCTYPTRRVAHHRQVTHQAARLLPAAVPLVPVVPVYAYPPPIFYRPAPLFYGVRPFYRPYFYPYLYRPYLRGPYGYGRGFY